MQGDDRSVDEDMTNTVPPSERTTVKPKDPEVPPGWACPLELRGVIRPLRVVRFAEYDSGAECVVTIRPQRL